MKLIRMAMDATGKVQSPEEGAGFNNCTPIDIGIDFNVVANVKAYKYSPQMGTKVSIATVTSDGVTSGIMTCQ